MKKKKETRTSVQGNEDSLQGYLENGNLAFYGYLLKALPDFIFRARKGRVKVFTKNGRAHHSADSGNVPVFHYSSLSEIRDQLADVYFLDNEAVKVLFAEFPGAAHYVLIRFVPRLSWIVAIPGLVRRIFIGLIKIDGVITLQEKGNGKRWLVLRHILRESLNTRLCLSSEVGIRGFLDFLQNENITYVVLRFFEKLPELNREGGDLDILVTDEDDQKIRDFLQAHPGQIGVDVWTVSRSKHNDITYFPPPLARKIVKSAVDGPAGAKIPAPKESFLSFAYHVLYHKGFFAGVPSTMPDAPVHKNPENDYAGVLTRMAKNLGLGIEINMESLDEYLNQEGWRPKIDTLAKIASRNKWAWERFFSVNASEEVGLGMFILKKKAFDMGVADSILRTVSEREGFKILRTKVFAEEEVMRVANTLRGGVWNDLSGSVRDFLPAMAVLVLDTHTMRSRKMSMAHSNPDKEIGNLKKILRRTFDTGKISLVHSTDNTNEAWEYITACFPQEIDAIEKEVERAWKEMKLSWFQQMTLRLSFLPRYIMYRLTRLKRGMKSRAVRIIMGD